MVNQALEQLISGQKPKNDYTIVNKIVKVQSRATTSSAYI